MVKPLEVIEDVLIALGISVSLADIHQILSIVILVFNVIWILFKLGVKIYEKIKSKNIKEIGDDIKETADELKKLDDSLKNSDSTKGE